MIAAAGPSVHASAVAVGGLGILVRGRSGAGKSRLALNLLLAGRCGAIAPARLVGDDRLRLERRGDELVARCAPGLEGLIEIRGLGLRRCDAVAEASVGLVVDLGAADAARLPDAKSLETAIDGVLLQRIPVGEGVDALPLVLGWLLTRPPT